MYVYVHLCVNTRETELRQSLQVNIFRNADVSTCAFPSLSRNTLD